MAIALNTTIAPTRTPAQPAAVIPFPRDYRDAIRAGRKPLPSRELTDVPVRRFVASVCQAEINHACNDFWRVVDGSHGPSIVRDFLKRSNRRDRARKAEWLQRRRTLVHDLIRAANAYRAARASLA